MAKRIFLFALVLIAATNETCTAAGTSLSSLGFKKSKVSPQSAAVEQTIAEESKNAKSERIRSGSTVAPEPVKKAPSPVDTDSDSSGESKSKKRIHTNEIRRYFESITDEIIESHYVPKVKKRPSLPWLRPYQEERNMTEQYNQCSRGNVTNRLMTCTSGCIENAYDLFSSQDREEELAELCVKRCTNSGKLFIAEKAERIENYNSQQQRR